MGSIFFKMELLILRLDDEGRNLSSLGYRSPALAFLGCWRGCQGESRAPSYDGIRYGTEAAVASIRICGRSRNHIFSAGVVSSLLLFPKTSWSAIGTDSEFVLAFLAPDTGCTVGPAQLAIQKTGVFGGSSAAAITAQRRHVARVPLFWIRTGIGDLRSIQHAHGACGGSLVG